MEEGHGYLLGVLILEYQHMRRLTIPQLSSASVQACSEETCCSTLVVMAEDGENDLGFTPAQQEWIKRLVENHGESHAHASSSADSIATTSSSLQTNSPQTTWAGNLGKSLFT